MSRIARRVVELMARDGFIPAVEAARISGHAYTTLYDWITEGSPGRGKIESRRAGQYWFVSRAALLVFCPQLRESDLPPVPPPEDEADGEGDDGRAA